MDKYGSQKPFSNIIEAEKNHISQLTELFNLWSSEVAIGGIIVLILTLTASLFIERPWCKYARPFGAFLGTKG